jgi:hypothetical protein
VASLKYRLSSSLFLTEAARTLGGLVTRSESDPKKHPGEEIKQYVLRADAEYAVYREGQPQKFSHFYDHYDIDLAIHPKAESSKTKVKLMEAVLGEIKHVTQSRQIPLLVLIEPSVIDLTENARVTYKDLQAYKDYRRDTLTRSIEAICMGLGMARVNLFEVFMSNRPEALYFRDPDDHWNDAGQDLAARVTAAYVARNVFKGPSKLLEK